MRVWYQKKKPNMPLNATADTVRTVLLGHPRRTVSSLCAPAIPAPKPVLRALPRRQVEAGQPRPAPCSPQRSVSPGEARPAGWQWVAACPHWAGVGSQDLWQSASVSPFQRGDPRGTHLPEVTQLTHDSRHEAFFCKSDTELLPGAYKS